MKVNSSDQYCTFYLGNQLLGIEALNVQEITQQREFTKVPRSPSSVKGMINLRGQLVVAIDLRTRFSMEECTDESEQMNIIMRVNDEMVSLIVDKIGEVIRVDNSNYEDVPAHLNQKFGGLFTGIYKLEKELLAVLNLEKTLQLSK